MRVPAFNQLNLESLAIQSRITAAQAALLPLHKMEVAKNTMTDFGALSERVQRAQGFRIGFVGSIKAGKSTLLTALLNGELIMPSEARVCTAALTCIHGSKGDPKAIATPMTGQDLRVIKTLAELDNDPRDANWVKKAVDALKARFKRERPEAKDEELDQELETFLKDLEENGESRAHMIENAKVVMARLARLKKGADWSWPESERKNKQFEQNGSVFDLNRWASARGDFGGLVSCINIHWPCDWLPIGATLVDTPGLQDPIPSRSKITYEETKHLDAVVMCVGGLMEKGHFKDLAKLINEFGIDPKRILVARTRIDSLGSRSDLLAILDQTREQLAIAGWKDIQVVPVCPYAVSVALTNNQGLNLIAQDDWCRELDEAKRLATKLEKLLDLTPGTDLDLEARLWRASNLDVLVEAMDGVVKASNAAKANLVDEAEHLFAKVFQELESDLVNLKKRENHLDQVVQGKSAPEEIATEAAELLLEADKKDEEKKFNTDRRDELRDMNKGLEEMQDTLHQKLSRSYRPSWRKVELGGWFTKNTEIGLITRGDGKRCIQKLEDGILATFPNNLHKIIHGCLNSWADEVAPQIEENANTKFCNTREFGWWHVSKSDWATLQDSADSSWQENGSNYLGTLVGSLVGWLSQELEGLGRQVHACATDLEAQASDLRADAEVMNLALAKFRLEDVQESIQKLDHAISAFKAIIASHE